MKTSRRLVIALSMCHLACSTQAGGEAPAGAASSSVGANKATEGRTKEARRQRLPLLGAGERRVSLVVAPGDASVEVDGREVSRRDGLVDLVGKVGDQRRVRVWKGDKSTGEKTITIRETGASPETIDLNETTEPAPTNVAAKAKAVQFGFDE
jgi:eukaryotic-like serine/threonine-protein kinase